MRSRPPPGRSRRRPASANLLIAELNHRVKNTLAIVQSIASPDAARPRARAVARSLGSRLHALAKAHDVLTRQNWEGAPSARRRPRRGFTAHGDLDRFQIVGPRVWLTPSLSVLMAMILHELATNAVKYGALGADGGTVSIAWETTEDRDWLTLRWVERGGPTVGATTQGFGSRLLGGQHFRRRRQGFGRLCGRWRRRASSSYRCARSRRRPATPRPADASWAPDGSRNCREASRMGRRPKPADGDPHAPPFQLRRPRRRGAAASHHQPVAHRTVRPSGAGARRGRLRLR